MPNDNDATPTAVGQGRTLAEVKARWEQGGGWPPGVHFNVTAKADVFFLLEECAKVFEWTTKGLTRDARFTHGYRENPVEALKQIRRLVK